MPTGRESPRTQRGFSAPVSPLDEILSARDELVEADLSRLEELHAEIARCMSKKGFDYEPVNVRAQYDAAQTAAAEDADRSSVDWVRQFGFGITTRVTTADLQFEQVSRLGSGEDTEPLPTRVGEDGVIEVLDSVDAVAYQEALYGSGVDGSGGCLATASASIFGERAAVVEQDELGRLLSGLADRIESDPRVVQDRQHGRSCLTGWRRNSGALMRTSWCSTSPPLMTRSSRRENALF